MASLNREVISGTKFIAISTYSNVLINLIIGAVMARLLSPAEYGVVAMITVFVTFFNLLSDIGLGTAVVQFRDLTKNQLSSLFNFSVLTGLVLAGSFAVFSHYISDFYSNKDYIKIGYVLSIPILLSTINAIPNGLLRKGKRFSLIAKLNVVVNVLTGISAIGMALAGMSYWALVFRSVIRSSLLFILSFIYSKPVIAWRLNLKGLAVVGKYSLYQLMFNFVNYFSRNLDNILIGKYMGEVPLGLYNRAYSLMSLPISNLTHVFTPVLHPVLSGHVADKALIFKTHLKVVKYLLLIGMPLSVFLFIARAEIITILYGSQWTGSIGAFKWLALSVWVQMILSSTGSIFQAAGSTKYLFISGFLSAIMTVTAIILGILTNDIAKVSLFLFIAFSINLLQGFYILYIVVLKQSLVPLFKLMLNPFIIGVICFISLYLVSMLTSGLYLRFVLMCLAFGLSVFAGMIFTGEWNPFIKLLKNIRG